jgi:hypothetical protein
MSPANFLFEQTVLKNTINPILRYVFDLLKGILRAKETVAVLGEIIPVVK